MAGSHIDTVVGGGRLDGAYGVLAGLEVVAALNDAGAETTRPIVVAAFSNEEGVRYQPDMMGSLVFAGGLDIAAAHATKSDNGETLRDDLARISYLGSDAVDELKPCAFVELHIEQGPVLEASGDDIGVVGGVQGISWTEYVFEGAANHAGTTPMALRRDAGASAARLAAEANLIARESDGAVLASAGVLDLTPGVVNVVAARARVTLDVRSPDASTLATAQAGLDAFARSVAAEASVELSSRRLVDFDPVRFDAGLCDVIETAATRRGARTRRMISGAGHDAQMIARIAPAAMIFTPSRGGVSHSHEEHTDSRRSGAGRADSRRRPGPAR